MKTSTILAIDLGKYNSVSCHYEPDSKATEYRTIRTTPDEIRKLLTRIPVKIVVIEACSGAGWVTDLCQSLNINVVVANTAGEAWKWQHVKRKTDKDDAIKLARLAAMNELPIVPMPPKEIREWKSLIGLRKRQELASLPAPFADVPFPGRVARDKLHWLRVKYDKAGTDAERLRLEPELLRRAEEMGDRVEAVRWRREVEKRPGQVAPPPREAKR